jgi:shikimate dehydrogenase
MVPLHVGSNDFQKALDGLRSVNNFAGAILTVPHKHEAYSVAEVRSPMVQDTEMANVLVPVGQGQWSAEMLDGVGLFNALRKRNISTAGLRTLIIGAGGAGTAIAVALQQLGRVLSFGIVDIDNQRAEKLVAKLDNAERADPDPAAYQLVVNATPVGMGSAELPADPRRILPGTVVCDAVMDPPKTRFLREAENRGCTVVEGKEMLLGQVAPIVRFLGLHGGFTAAGEISGEQ